MPEKLRNKKNSEAEKSILVVKRIWI